MPTFFQRPENALKRANEFIDVGKKQRALDALYDVIKSKKHRTWQKIHEPIMEKYLELCVELRKSHVAKEGLYQYKNICQQVNINSLVDVVKKYIRLAEEKTEAARQESHQSVVDIDDLDLPDSPDRLLKAVSGEDTQDRTDRAILTPWVKFLWESYRQCLDLLRNNSRVERLYQDIAQQAFQFCLKYGRKTEFRKLCDNLRTHLGHISKHQHQQTAINLNNPESQAMHLETRLVQLDSAINMELWQEAFKAVEDIHGLLNLSKKTPKPALMANYFNKISLVFYKSNNHLFHAGTLHRLFHLSREQRKNLSQDELQKMASRVLCATLAIPIPTARNAIGQLLETDESSLDKKRRLATLLMLPCPPTRQGLIKDLMKFNVIQYVHPELQNLYRNLECEFQPLRLYSKISSCLDFISKSEDLCHYLPALEDILIIRVLKQVAQVYQTIELSRLANLLPFTSRFRLEQVIVNAAKQLELQVRIDHRSQSLSFGTNLSVAQKEDVPEGPHIQNMPSEQIRIQMCLLAQALEKSVELLKPKEKQIEAEAIKQTIIKNYRMTAKEQHQRILARRQIIEDRKEQLEHLNDERERQEQEQMEEQRRKAYEAEMLRLEREAEERKKQRQEQEHQEIKRRHVKERIEQLRTTPLGSKIFGNIQEEDLAEMDVDEIMQKQVEQLEKEKRELMERLKAQEKRVDYMVRAKRLEEIPLLIQQAEEEQIETKKIWEQQEGERITQMKEEREHALATKIRLARMIDKEKFITELKERRISEYESKKEHFLTYLAEEKKLRLIERKKQRKEERRQKWLRDRDEERQRRQDEELLREREEKERLEQEKRAAEEQAYHDKLAKLQEQAARQKEVEERVRKRMEETSASSKPEGPGADQSWRPSFREGGWREREKERENSWKIQKGDEGHTKDEGDGGSSWRDRKEKHETEKDEGSWHQSDLSKDEKESYTPAQSDWRHKGDDKAPTRDDRSREEGWRDRPHRGDDRDASHGGDHGTPRGDERTSWRGSANVPRDDDVWRRRAPPREDREPERDWRGRGDDDSRGLPKDEVKPVSRSDDDWRRGPKLTSDGDTWRRGGDKPPAREDKRDDRRGFDDRERRGGGFDREGRGGGFDRDDRRGGGFDKDDRRGGFDRDERRGGFDRDDRRSGFDRDERRGGFDRDERRGGFDRSERRGGFDRDERRSGFDRDERRSGFDRDERRGGFDRDEKRLGFDREERRGGFDRDEKRGFDRDDRRGGFDSDERKSGFIRDDRRGFDHDERRGLDRDRRVPEKEERRAGVFDRDERKGGTDNGERRPGGKLDTPSHKDAGSDDGPKKRGKPSEEADDGWTTVRR